MLKQPSCLSMVTPEQLSVLNHGLSKDGQFSSFPLMPSSAVSSTPVYRCNCVNSPEH